MSKITKTTFKTFIKKNADKLLISYRSSFDGMQDCVTCSDDKSFRPITPTDKFIEHSYGITGLWLVGGGRDYFRMYEAEGLVGIEVSNSCGTQIIAINH